MSRHDYPLCIRTNTSYLIKHTKPDSFCFFFFFLNDPPPTDFSPLPLHAPLPISPARKFLRCSPPPLFFSAAPTAASRRPLRAALWRARCVVKPPPASPPACPSRSRDSRLCRPAPRPIPSPRYPASPRAPDACGRDTTIPRKSKQYNTPLPGTSATGPLLARAKTTSNGSPRPRFVPELLSLPQTLSRPTARPSRRPL